MKITNSGADACTLGGLPRISIHGSNGAPLPIRQSTAHPQLRSVTLVAHGGTAWLTVSWSNWCHSRPGPLNIAVTLPGTAGTIDGPFNGPPDYNFVPPCLAASAPSRMSIDQAYAIHD